MENSLLFASALSRAKVPFDLHSYQKGKHGLGLPAQGAGAPPWDTDCIYWLGQRGFLSAPPR